MNKKYKEIKDIVRELNLEEKAKLCVGKDFWHLQGIERLGIPSVMLTDGPHGLRKQTGKGDHLGLGDSNPATCFPAGCTTTSSFDKELVKEIGIRLGEIGQAEDVSLILGPAINIKRSPLCGRNFEYYSEDPYLSTEMASGLVQGIQSKHVGACPKHFLANNQELRRMTCSSEVDERTLREIYLASFEGVVKEAKPWSIMCSYNRINGIYASQNKEYLTDILRKEWGFDGYVVTDWGAMNERVESLAAGTDVEMPGPGEQNTQKIIDAVKNGTLEEEILDRACERILNIILKYAENRQEKSYDYEAGHETARRAEAESAVLLKNEDSILPLNSNQKIAIIGKFAMEPRYQGGGSSHINAYKVTSVLNALEDNENIVYAQGYDAEPEELLIEEAVNIARDAEIAVIFAGLPDDFESEGYDRIHMGMPVQQNRLIEAVAEVQPNVVVVLHNGSPVEMPWIGKVKGVLEAYLGGEAVGHAIADILFGKVNPSGRLAETFPLRIEDTPTYPYYGVEKDEVVYREGILIGYRYYETKKIPVLFPFGHGLSYTTFNYSNLSLDKESMKDSEMLTIKVDVTNSGTMAGKEVVQLYVSQKNPAVVRPVRELKGFNKLWLEPGETKTVAFELDKHAFAYWNTEIHDWYAPSDAYCIQIGKSVSDILMEQEVKLESTTVIKQRYHLNSPMGDIMSDPAAMKILQQTMGQMLGSKAAVFDQPAGDSAVNAQSIQTMMDGMPLRALMSYIPHIKVEQLEQLLSMINQR